MPERKFIQKKLLLNNMLYLYEKKRRGGREIEFKMVIEEWSMKSGTCGILPRGK
jgi:hypothetical protein